MSAPLRLAPSSFAYLWRECKRCYWLEIYGYPRPRAPFPSIFSKIDSIMKTQHDGKRTEELKIEGLAPGTFRFARAKVEFRDTIQGREIVLPGKTDMLVDFDDGTLGIIDFKTGNNAMRDADVYWPQLMSYVMALEQSGDKSVSTIGILNLSPEAGVLGKTSEHVLGVTVIAVNLRDSALSKTESDLWLKCARTWRPLEIDRQRFAAFLEEVVGAMNGPLPEAEESCPYCQYR